MVDGETLWAVGGLRGKALSVLTQLTLLALNHMPQRGTASWPISIWRTLLSVCSSANELQRAAWTQHIINEGVSII